MIKKSKSQKLTFKKTITRDWPLFVVESFHEGLTKEFKKQFSFSYSEVLIDCHPDHIDIYRAPIEHIDKMRDFILKKLKVNSYFFISCAKKLLNFYSEFEKIVKKIDFKNLKSLENRELRNLLNIFLKPIKRLSQLLLLTSFFQYN